MKNLILWAMLGFVVGCGDISSSSVVGIFSDDGKCSGSFVESDRIATSSHCVELGSTVTVYYLDETDEPQTIKGKVIYSEDKPFGTAIVDVDLDGPPVTLCDTHIGSRVKLWGWISDKPESDKGRILLHWSENYVDTTESKDGLSGGPVVADGCVIGMHQGKTERGNSYVTGIKMDYLTNDS
jgi:hypothetical protein